ncbi:disease resistance protein PIK6-NP-like [Hordeum vulgare subsp. vulgare]|uniref:RGH1 n=1 Tax=Hordeum vulgare subsp. vulgare TaxID=112509 RepID=A0A8I7B4H7_HORVV|nr:disease resistance protein PIK6-NP-like [Hordeum vulgare subsp. vulgare]
MAMSIATGAMGSLLPKLIQLLNEEVKLQKGVKERVRSLEQEMRSMQAVLQVVGEVPREQLDAQVKLWAGEVRELSFKMEDVVDKFLVNVDDGSEPAAKSNKLKRLTKKMAGLFTKGKDRHQIAHAINDINKQVQEVAERRARYNLDNIVIRPAAVTVNPLLRALYTEVTELVGIDGKRDQALMELLSNKDDVSNKKLKIVSVVGFGGLGKTTLVKTVYDKIKGDFDCRAFVSVGQKADPKKVLMDILLDLGVRGSQLTLLDETQLVKKLLEYLEEKRYLIVIDDIWEAKLWKIINYAFSRGNNAGSRLITTTRIVDVSKLCCSTTNDSVYPMEPLSDYDSQRLFHKRIFSQENGCPREFEKVSRGILKKCGGVPLAIITIASVLASDQKVNSHHEWQVLLESIGCGLTEDPSVEEMLRILSFSYYDLPCHLKTCLLYLSMFPEDHMIMKDKLIWMWIAERFIQCETTQSSLFEIGENYFNELVNRSLLQPVSDDYGIVCACRVHDSVLDLICLLSREENFVSVLNGSLSSAANVRRLSLQKIIKEEQETTPLESASMLQVRSIATFVPVVGLMPHFSGFVVLRVLNLSECWIDKDNLGELWNLVHLRYLGLSDTGLDELPEEVEKLRFLQVLDVSQNGGIEKLPSSVTKLRRLMCLLYEGSCNRLPDGIGNLTAMEELSCIHGDSLSIVKEMGRMKRLRKFEIKFEHMSLELEEAFVKSLGEMSNVQSVTIIIDGGSKMMDLLGEKWVPSQGLRVLNTRPEKACRFSRLPAWIRENPSRMSQLSCLYIGVKEVQQVDLGLLGRLPALHTLILESLRQGPLLVEADGFRCITLFSLWSGSPGQVVFQPGALPKAEEVWLRTGLPVPKEEADGNNGSELFDTGIGNLQPSLRSVRVQFCTSLLRKEAEEAKSALKTALSAHPNRPYSCLSVQVNIGNEDDGGWV